MTSEQKKWYILNVMAGQENKVASDLKSMIVRGAIDKYVSEAFVPTKPVMKVKKGQKVQEMQKLFPGYVFINANLEGEAYNLINSIPKVMGFLGGKNNPQPVAEPKMQEILNLSSQQAQEAKNFAFEIGETLNIIEGPFESFSGVVEEFDVEKQKVKISVLIFGRATSVELDVNQVEKGS
ncbi:MAG: transcription termination/antitermination factor NusG [Alphaproteobacteria bacterium RIFCSPLOWO2_01_FULL_40_26]|nr:MAG: transcription termination/antitermination factor NusG [Alphaproteobacteria bacterium RIFCSPHIGHO2_02_FULL_40_34]OFW88760.1 MAG: transcription termination/antitermination factor NusG [Alphaproteobacteria bacterium RIFCSPHIGHO2_01_FULL_40_8]OFW94565.1 MAG: transcription termination/antitermination factor NusG [Alphaproteobacteria bacterium RIFCSPLOWO2_01_FULL_40_26]OFX10315.1 MAG: transcription termination/antitermination factor NusG [Alphaproteobacteria bacterium RIFCSPLOWO2_02_FULL_40_19